MLNGLYAGAAGMMAQQARIDAIANDLANVNTTGYRSQRVSFADLVYQPQGSSRTTPPDSLFGAGAAVSIVDRSTIAGTFLRDDDPLHLAIDGPGFFQVRRADGSVALTRDGSFSLDSDRRLVTSGGELVVPELRIPAEVDINHVSVAADGTVSAGGPPLGRVEVVSVAAPQRLQPVGANLFVATEESGAPAAGGGAVLQGGVEGSNVDIATAMTSLIEAQRAYELNSRAIRTADELLSIANQIRR